MTYAGRLDPMAEGLMIILIDAECKNKENYTNQYYNNFHLYINLK